MGVRETYAVQWMLRGKEHWKFYSTYEPLERSQACMRAALQAPGCMEVRLVRRTETLTVVEHRRKEEAVG